MPTDRASFTSDTDLLQPEIMPEVCDDPSDQIPGALKRVNSVSNLTIPGSSFPTTCPSFSLLFIDVCYRIIP